MRSLFTAAPAYRTALYEAAKTLLEPDGVLVLMGPPEGGSEPDDIVIVQHVRTELQPAAMGPTRQREESLVLDVLVSCATGGGPEVDQDLTAHAYELLGRLEYYVRVTDTTLGGVVRQCFLTDASSSGAGPDDLADGRFIEIQCTFTAANRVSGRV